MTSLASKTSLQDVLKRSPQLLSSDLNASKRWMGLVLPITRDAASPRCRPGLRIAGSMSTKANGRMAIFIRAGGGRCEGGR